MGRGDLLLRLAADGRSDCFKPNQLGRIARAMEKHFSGDEIDQILYRNANRLFEKGWVSAREAQPRP